MASSSTMTQPRCSLQLQQHHQVFRSSRRPAAPSRASFAAAATSSINKTATSLSISATTATAPGVASAAATTSTPTTTRSRTAASVANMWRQVQGSHDWDGLLQPLHPVVRDEVARYGELVGACYTALDVDPSSPRFMCCKHAKDRVLQESGVHAGAEYEVTRYIYATPDVATGPSSSSTTTTTSWVGYVAVSTDEMTRRLGRRDVLVSFRGTVTQAEWVANLMSALEPAGLDGACPDVKVEAGFLNLYTSSPSSAADGMGSCREQLLREVSRVVKSFSGEEEEMSVTLAGHSMGSALATLLGYDLSQLGLNRDAASGRRVPVTVFSFGGPRVGNAAFKDRCDELGVKVLRAANVRDPVTMLPPGSLFNEGGFLGSAWAWPGAAAGDRYTHVGVELALDFLSLSDLGSVHDLGAYVSSIKAQAAFVSRSDNNAAPDSRGAAKFAWPEAVLGIGDMVQSLGFT